MDFKDLVMRNRSYRRFDASHKIERETLVELAALARCTASAANIQPIRYILSVEPEQNDKIFGCLAWAAYLKDWPGPEPSERPAAYMVLLIDQTLTKDWWCDDGIAAQTILLGAVEKGLGGCMLGAINRDKLRAELDIPEQYKIRLVLALGKPAETAVIEEVQPGGSIRYWRDDQGVHHVPKRTIEELILR
jgi:nitroreductase